MENNDQNNNTSNPSSSGEFLDPSEWEKWGNDFLKEALMGLNNNMNTMNYDQFDPSLIINNPPQQTNQLHQQQQEQPLLLDFGNLNDFTMNNPYMDFPCFVSPSTNPNPNPNVPNNNVISNVPNVPVPVAPSPMVLPEDYHYHQQFQPQQVEATPVEDEESQILSMFWRQQLLDIQNLEGRGNALPIARVRKIMKSDKDVKMISGESPVVLAKACEIFIKELGLRAWLSAQHNKRRTIHRDDVTSAIAHHDVFDFLHDFFQINPNNPQQQQQSHIDQPHPHASSSAGITTTTTTSVVTPPSSTTININPGIHLNPPLSQPPLVMQPPFPPPSSSSSPSSQFPYYFPPNN